MDRRCHFCVTVFIETDQCKKKLRFTGEKSLPFIPSEGRDLHLGGRDVCFKVDSAVYDMERGLFLVDGRGLGPDERSRELADGLRRLGWQEEEEEGESEASFFARTF